MQHFLPKRSSSSASSRPKSAPAQQQPPKDKPPATKPAPRPEHRRRYARRHPPPMRQGPRPKIVLDPAPGRPSPDEQELNLLCPVRALRTYIDRSASFRQAEQLFVCFGGRTKGLPKHVHTRATTPRKQERELIEPTSLKAYAAFQATRNPCFSNLLPVKVHWNSSQSRDFPPVNSY
ncbi:hypothetical protein DPX16_6494 [Anabarilius grahami]|uniref:Uncharacterized protein n=1 Tax=Anabarilius grahami TaxID=495550 RepID=A0A3N0YCU7_ANAGA|nr:hypothetical protein DPX16_6494 [Anabarilius grahami]